MLARCFLLVFAVATSVQGQRIIEARAHLQSSVVSGSITFREQDDGTVLVIGEVFGLAPGAYGFHVHQLGDTGDSCAAAGAHFNPKDVTHGGPDHEVRHHGDLGNVQFDADGIARISIVDRLLTLNGADSIVGRALVLHEGEDDLGLTDHPDSLTTGNAGARVACGVIGITSEVSAASGFTAVSWAVFLSALANILRY